LQSAVCSATTVLPVKKEVDVVSNRRGNFRALLEFRADGGDDLAAQLREAHHNATYISKTTQNLLIASCGNVVREKLPAVLKSPNFSLF